MKMTRNESDPSHFKAMETNESSLNLDQTVIRQKISSCACETDLHQIMNIPSVSLNEETHKLEIIDQTLLPNEIRVLSLDETEKIVHAIRTLQVRGAPAIGVAAAIGLYACAYANRALSLPIFQQFLLRSAALIETARPTAVNLSWAIQRMLRCIPDNAETTEEIVEKLHSKCLTIWNEDIRMCKKIGLNALNLLKDGMGILTHCNAGQLATSKFGTALSPLHLGKDMGFHFKVFADETRPLLQGARLTAYELQKDGIDVTLICDNMASQVMKNGWIDAVLVGCDHVAANGDVCNKIGTSGVAILAKYYGIPFYVLGPTSTIDLSLQSGADIPIEERSPDEVTRLWYQKCMAPKDIKVFNPSFDVTPNNLVTAIITEKGIAKPPYSISLAEQMK